MRLACQRHDAGGAGGGAPALRVSAIAPALDVWLVDVLGSSAALNEIECCEPRLPNDEKERAGAGGDGALRAAWRTCRIALRLLIERCAGPELARRPFACNSAGKPHVPGASLHFNLSHRQGFALIVLSHGERVGVDLEAARRLTLPGPRRASLRAAAAAMIAGQPLPAGDAGTLQAWTRLEAAAKAEGDGIGRLLTDLGLRGPRGGGPDADVRQRTRAWLETAQLDVVDLALPQGLFGALAARGAQAPVTLFHFPAELRDVAALAHTGAASFGS